MECWKKPRRNRILLEQRERIVRAFEDTNEDYLMVADTIGVNRSTKYRRNIDYFMVGERVRFLFTSCEESQTNEQVFERVRLRFCTTSE